METYSRLQDLCSKIIEGKIDIKEFQSRLLTISLPESQRELQKYLAELDNELEQIIFCQLEEDQSKLACLIADNLLKKIQDNIS